MSNRVSSQGLSIFIFFVLLVSVISREEAQTCKPSGKIKGKKTPPGFCENGNDSDCCVEGKLYATYKCSPPVSRKTRAVLKLTSFDSDYDEGRPSTCDGKFYTDEYPVVTLSTGWFNRAARCLFNITIHGNGRRIKARVVNECDSTVGCDADDDFQPPCANNVVQASKAVWKALGVPKSEWGDLHVYWSDDDS